MSVGTTGSRRGPRPHFDLTKGGLNLGGDVTSEGPRVGKTSARRRDLERARLAFNGRDLGRGGLEGLGHSHLQDPAVPEDAPLALAELQRPVLPARGQAPPL